MKSRLLGAAGVIAGFSAIFSGGIAQAQCLPTTNPTTGQTVTCTGVSATPISPGFGDGNITVNILSGASLSGGVTLYDDSVLNNDGSIAGTLGSGAVIRGQRTTIANTGLLQTLADPSIFTLASAVNFIQNADLGVVTNAPAGVIRAVAGIFGAGIVSDHDITVTNSGLIEGRGGNANGINATEGSTVINSGTIRAAAVPEQGFAGSIVAVDLTGTNIGGDARVENLSGGLIEIDLLGNFSFSAAAIATGAGNDTIINAGVIRGNIRTGDGDDLFEVRPGSTLEGDFYDGEGGTDIVRFAATGAMSLDAPFAFFDFETAEKTGAGALSISGFAAFNDLFVRAGSLALAAGSELSVSGLTIESGASLLGEGIANVSTLALLSGAVLAPGASIGTLTVSGDVDFATGSIFDVEADATSADLLDVDGAVTIANGARMRVTTLGAPTTFGGFGSSTTYTVIAATGTVTGNFTVDPLAFFTASSVNAGSRIDLTLTRNSAEFTTFADTPNQGAVGGALETDCSTAAGALLAACNTLTFSTVDALRSGLDALSGAGLAHFRTLSLESALLIGDAIDTRFRRYYGGPDDIETKRRGGLQAFAQAFGTDSEIDGAAGAPGLDGRHRGFVIGGEAPLSDRVAAGLHFGMASSDGDAAGGAAASIESETILFGGHLVGEAGGTRGQLRVSYASVDGDTTRVLGPTFASAIAGAETDADLLIGAATVARRFSLGDFRVTPEAALIYANASFDGFTETGAAELGLTVADADDDYAHAQIAATLARPFARGAATLTPHLTAGYRRTLTGADAAITAAFQGGGDFIVSAADAGENAMVLNGGLSGGFGAASVFVNYEGLIAEDGARHGVRAGVRVVW